MKTITREVTKVAVEPSKSGLRIRVQRVHLQTTTYHVLYCTVCFSQEELKGASESLVNAQ
jgi:hypothetical protein